MIKDGEKFDEGVGKRGFRRDEMRDDRLTSASAAHQIIDGSRTAVGQSVIGSTAAVASTTTAGETVAVPS